MQELEQLIQKFWANQTTKTENKRLLQLLEQYKAMPEEVEPDELFDEMEGQGAGLPPDRAMSILQGLHGRLGIDDKAERQKKRSAIVRRLYSRVAVAAGVAALILSVFLWAGGRHTERPAVAVAPAAHNDLVSVVNNADTALALVLEDGSAVQLEKNSSLSYYKPFINDRRDISLKGIAVFKVARDKKRPFTVYAGGIATTALGTRFLVNSTDTKKVVVRLLEGKVVIRTAAGLNMTMSDVYLSPGQEFSFDKNSRQYAVNTIHDRAGDAGRAAAPAARPELVFRKEPLDRVFEKVGRLYSVSMNFRREDLQGLYFTGTFLKSDNLDIVLSTICNVNDLHLARNGNTIAITRSH
jgi:transmembrane sensor